MRLIDADALKKEVDNFQNCYNGWSDTYDKAYIIEAIEEAPTIEPKRGEWVVYEGGWKDLDYYPPKCKCNQCGYEEELYILNAKPTNFCPNCGARMKGADDE